MTEIKTPTLWLELCNISPVNNAFQFVMLKISSDGTQMLSWKSPSGNVLFRGERGLQFDKALVCRIKIKFILFVFTYFYTIKNGRETVREKSWQVKLVLSITFTPVWHKEPPPVRQVRHSVEPSLPALPGSGENFTITMPLL